MLIEGLFANLNSHIFYSINHMYASMHIIKHACMNECMCVLCVHIYVYKCTHVCMFVHMYCIDIRTYSLVVLCRQFLNRYTNPRYGIGN